MPGGRRNLISPLPGQPPGSAGSGETLGKQMKAGTDVLQAHCSPVELSGVEGGNPMTFRLFWGPPGSRRISSHVALDAVGNADWISSPRAGETPLRMQVLTPTGSASPCACSRDKVDRRAKETSTLTRFGANRLCPRSGAPCCFTVQRSLF